MSTQLPIEIWESIFLMLPHHSLVPLSLTCKMFYGIVKEDFIPHLKSFGVTNFEDANFEEEYFLESREEARRLFKQYHDFDSYGNALIQIPTRVGCGRMHIYSNVPGLENYWGSSQNQSVRLVKKHEGAFGETELGQLWWRYLTESIYSRYGLCRLLLSEGYYLSSFQMLCFCLHNLNYPEHFHGLLYIDMKNLFKRFTAIAKLLEPKVK